MRQCGTTWGSGAGQGGGSTGGLREARDGGAGDDRRGGGYGHGGHVVCVRFCLVERTRERACMSDDLESTCLLNPVSALLM